MNVVGFGLNDGSGFWRMRIPFGEMNLNGHHCYVSPNAINEDEMKQADVVVLKNCTDQRDIATALAMREIKRIKIVMDVDDDLIVNDDHPFKNRYDKEATFTFQQTAKNVDVVTTTTEYLANKLRKLNPNVVVLPNYYDPEWFNVTPRKNTGPVRIGWAGGGTHESDLKMMTPVIERLLKKYPVTIVARGDDRLKKMWGESVELYPTVPIEYYPEALAGMGIDIGICPLIDNEFNRCKSPIKAMEYGLLGIPSVCSPTVYGQLPILEIARDEDEWVAKLSKLIDSSPASRNNRSEVLKGYFKENFNIKYHWREYEKAYKG